MKEKIEVAQEIINAVARNYKNPLVYCGFGKDSIVMLHLIREMGLNWPIMCHREHEFPVKWRFANKIMELWNLTCYDYPPRACSVFYENDTFCVATQYGVGFGDLVLPGILYTPERFIEGEYLCALKDIYLQPKCHGFDYPWDVGLLAARFDEKHPHFGGACLGQQFENKLNIGSADFAYPLLSWTAQDVCQYHVDYGVPINTDVYEIKDGELISKQDPTYDPDRRPACYECMKPDNPKVVFCPKRMSQVNNVSGSLAWMPLVDFPTKEGE